MAGCSTATPSLTTLLVRQGTPAVDFGAEISPPPVRLATARPAIRELSRVSPVASDLEAEDAGLRDALAAVRNVPSVATHLAAAREYRRLGILDRAIDHLEQGAAFDEYDPAVNDALARTWRDWGMPGLGLTSAHRAVYAAPRSAIARHTLGTLLFALGRTADAEANFRAAVGLDSSAWYAWQNLCRLTLDSGRTQESIVLCQRATAARREAREASRHEPHH
jgi:tetratricopeptide (TPR) repeat protein